MLFRTDEESPVQGSWLCAAALLLAEASAGPAQGRVRPRAVEPPTARVLSLAFAQVAHAIGPSVVRLEVSGAEDDATGSGIILDTRGDVVTSSHLFDGWSGPPAGATAEPIGVVLSDGRRLGAELVGLDVESDVAVIRIFEPPHDLSAARFGDSDSAAVGEWVLAVGSPLDLDETFTAGIISARSELDGGGKASPQSYLLTDANINPGDSGGPLVDLDGQVIGLTTAMSAGPGGSYGYAVPINRVRRTAVAILKDGRVVRPYIGVGLRDLGDLDGAARRSLGSLATRGAVVSRVGRGTPAARAGLRPGDVITSVNNAETPTPAALVAIIARQEVGARVVVSFVRNGAPRVVPLSVGDLAPAGGTAASLGP
jgi:S1-C subfamily serine protease